MASTLHIGAEGEKAAMEWLRQNGFVIAERNWRSAPHEIDIVAVTPDGHYHFVEVKTRHEGSLTAPVEAMTRKKIANLTKAANHYIEMHSLDVEAWIDFIGVTAHDDGSHSVEFIPDVANPHW
ncbi:MAG: YraN family protein [Tidjanibacter sp.]|nr:YraN family protein [Tidjanibacter sp.]